MMCVIFFKPPSEEFDLVISILVWMRLQMNGLEYVHFFLLLCNEKFINLVENSRHQQSGALVFWIHSFLSLE